VIGASASYGQTSKHVTTTTTKYSQLHQVGNDLIRAVLQKDVGAILKHDSPVSLLEDRQALKDPRSSLSCFLFDSSCYGSKRSVYENFTRASDLKTKVIPGGRFKGEPIAMLVFFDRAAIDEKQLGSPDYRCEHHSQLQSWTFKYTHGKWESTSAPFDAEIDSLCSPEARL
jgi:hypothetical protein